MCLKETCLSSFELHPQRLANLRKFDPGEVRRAEQEVWLWCIPSFLGFGHFGKTFSRTPPGEWWRIHNFKLHMEGPWYSSEISRWCGSDARGPRRFQQKDAALWFFHHEVFVGVEVEDCCIFVGDKRHANWVLGIPTAPNTQQPNLAGISPIQMVTQGRKPLWRYSTNCSDRIKQR